MRGFLLAIGIVALVAAAGPADVSAQGWAPQNSGVFTTLYEVLMTDINHGTAVGAGGVILRTTNGGATWVSVPSGTTTNLFGVDFCCVTNGIAVGDNGIMLRTTDTGATWTVLPQLTTDNLRGISFTQGSVGMVVGTNGAILRSTNGGQSWVEIRGITASLYEVSFITPDVGTVVGASGTILRTTNGGVSWEAQPSGTGQQLLGVSFTDVDRGTVVGGNGTIRRTTNGGASWFSQSSGIAQDLTSVTMIDESLGYVVGSAGVILRTTNGGSSWAQQSSGSTSGLKEVCFTDPATGTVVGENGTILRTLTGGEPGSALSLLSPNGGESYIVNTTMQIAWASAGFSTARIELSRDNGIGWETLTDTAPAANLGYDWTVQGPASDLCKVRVSDSANPALSDITSGVFAITPASVTGNYAVEHGWNLVSVPLTVPDYQKSVLYPSASSVAYSYDSANGYQVQNLLTSGTGYWLKFEGAQNISMTGLERFSDAVPVETGWNLLGSVSSPVPVTSLVTNPPGIITGVIYAFGASGYTQATTIDPGKAYWVKVDQPGEVLLNAPAPPRTE